MKTTALIFDMDGTMIDSMAFHWKSWVEFTRRHDVEIEVGELMRRTTGKTGVECIRAVFERDVSAEEALTLIDEKETIYRGLFAPAFAEVSGFKSFAAQAVNRGLKFAVGSAGDRHNIAFAFANLKLDNHPHAVVAGDEGFPGKPEPAIFLEAARRVNADPRHCIVFEDVPHGIEAARRAGMRAVAVCTGHSPGELDGPHVVARVSNYHDLMNTHFLESLHVS